MAIRGRHRRRKRRVSGHAARAGEMKRIPIGFDDDTLSEIDHAADLHATSFAEQVRQLVELGLETRKQEVRRDAGR